MDKEFREPEHVYFYSETVREIFGELFPYAPKLGYLSLWDESEAIVRLYRWLGVSEVPRANDVSSLVDRLTHGSPDDDRRSRSRKILMTIGNMFSSLTDHQKDGYRCLMSKAWLVSEDGDAVWRKPSELYAAYNKQWFESQAKFLDMPVNDQGRISDFLRYLGVKRSPEPILVARHLLVCAESNRDPPEGIYHWLNANAGENDVDVLRGEPCIRVDRKWLRSSQVFWGQHKFGRFRFQLGSEISQFRKLLLELGVKEAPDHEDAMQVLKDISMEKESKSHRLSDDDENVVLECWLMLSDALRQNKVDSGTIKRELGNTRCVPRSHPSGYKALGNPSSLLFEDRPGYREKFESISWNLIARQEHVWIAMEAAGVRSVTEAIEDSIHEAQAALQDGDLRTRFIERELLLEAVLGGIISTSQSSSDKISFGDIRFLRCETLIVRRELRGFGKYECTYESEYAYLDRCSGAVYFTIQSGDRPWSAIARELTLAVDSGGETKAIAPAVKTVLEAPSRDDAVAQLRDFDIPVPEGLADTGVEGEVADHLDEASGPTETLEDKSDSEEAVSSSLPTERQNGSIPSGIDSGLSGGDEQHDLILQQESRVDNDHLAEGTRSDQVIPFAQLFFGSHILISPIASDSLVSFPSGGPLTSESAQKHTVQSGQSGRSGSYTPKTRIEWELTMAARKLSEDFRSMVHGDYGRRCQLCGNTFTKQSDRDLQVFVVHIVKPSSDERTNHFGNLLGLCGWHYALLRYGEWVWLNPENSLPFEGSRESVGWGILRNYVTSNTENDPKYDEEDNPYFGLPVCFSNIFLEWGSEPSMETREIRYSVPHWTYLRELFKTT